MNRSLGRRAAITILPVITALLAAPAATAEPPEPVPATASWDFPAGYACEFHLVVTAEGARSNIRTFTGDDGGTVLRSVATGVGYEMTFTNADTGAAFIAESSGYSEERAYGADGSEVRTMRGTNAYVLFPTDITPGPSTILQTGRVQAYIDPQGNWEILSTAGTSTDICAALQ